MENTEKSGFEYWLKRNYPQLSFNGSQAALRLVAESHPVPYIAFQFQAEVEQMSAKQIYQLIDAKVEYDEITHRQEHILREIEAQKKLTDELKTAIERTHDLDRLEDFYLPFKLKKQTLAAQAKEAGLGEFSNYLWALAHGETIEKEISGTTLEEKAANFIKPETKFSDVDSVIKAAGDILVEQIAESSYLRGLVRSAVLRRSKLKSVKGPKAKQHSRYTKFFDYQEPVGSLKKSSSSYRYLMMRKGWMEDELVLSFDRPDEGDLHAKFEECACTNKENIAAELVLKSAHMALKSNVFTVMENEAHRFLKEAAEKHTIEALSDVLEKKLMHPPFGKKAVMGVDPGAADAASALVLLDQFGKYIAHSSIKMEDLISNESTRNEFIKTLDTLKIEAIAVAHGPKNKEVREVYKKILSEAGKNIPVISIHEHSSSIYAFSPVGKEEFPEMDLNTRRAAFVARYLQDPLFSLLKLDPKFFSLNEIQHEVHQNALRKALLHTLEISVNRCGVDLNHTPAAILAKVAGLDIDLAKAIVHYRETHGAFTTKEDLKKVPGITEKHFNYAVSFLRVLNGKEVLDNTPIHPKFFAVLKEFASQNSADITALTDDQLTKLTSDESLVQQLGGEISAHSIAAELKHYNQDIRGEFREFQFSTELKSMSDLKKDCSYCGLITNVTNFGAFVDVGIEQDGLLHLSEFAHHKNPFDELIAGDQVEVWVAAINEEKKQISFTLRNPAQKAREQRGPRHPRGEKRFNNNRRPRNDSNQQPQQFAAGGEQGQQHNNEQRPQRRPRPDHRNRDANQGDKKANPKNQEKRAPKKPNRDPKTGAIVKLDTEYSAKGQRFSSKAKPTTFNPFANLANILNKDKQD